MAKKQSKEQVREARHARAQEDHEARQKANAPVQKARDIRNTAMRKDAQDRRQAEVDLMTEAEGKDEKRKAEKPHLLDGKPGSGAGLKPGDMFAPKSNPGAAARVPMQPLQPESLQSHGKGILFDKDLDNPPYDAGDPELVDEGPSGSGSPSNAHAHSRSIDKKAEREKAEKATARSKQLDPDNPTRAVGGRKDATASPDPIGSRRSSKNDLAGGSNSGTDA